MMRWCSICTSVVLLFGSDSTKFVVAFQSQSSSTAIVSGIVQNIQKLQQKQTYNELVESECTSLFQSRSKTRRRRRGGLGGAIGRISPTRLFFGSQPDNPLEILDEVDPGLKGKKKNPAKESCIKLAYETLGIEPNTYLDKVVLKNAYKYMVTQYHPDVVTNKDSTPEEKLQANDNFAIINGAYKTLRMLYIDKDDTQLSGTYYSMKRGSTTTSTGTATSTNEDSDLLPPKDTTEGSIKTRKKRKRQPDNWWQNSFPRIYDSRDYFNTLPPLQNPPPMKGTPTDSNKEANININALARVNIDEQFVTVKAPETDSLVEEDNVVSPFEGISPETNGIDKPSQLENNDSADDILTRDQTNKKRRTPSFHSVSTTIHAWQEVISPPPPRKVYTRIPGRITSRDKRKAKDDFSKINGASKVTLLGQAGQTMISSVSYSSRSSNEQSKNKGIGYSIPSTTSSPSSHRRNIGSNRNLINKATTTNTSTRRREGKMSPTQSTYRSINSVEEITRPHKRHMNRQVKAVKINSSSRDTSMGNGAHIANASQQRNAKTRHGSSNAVIKTQSSHGMSPAQRQRNTVVKTQSSHGNSPMQRHPNPFIKKQSGEGSGPAQRRSNPFVKKQNSQFSSTGAINSWWQPASNPKKQRRPYLPTGQEHLVNGPKSPRNFPRVKVLKKKEPIMQNDAGVTTQTISNVDKASMKQGGIQVSTSLSTKRNSNVSREESQTPQPQAEDHSLANNKSKRPIFRAIPHWWDKYTPVQWYGSLPQARNYRDSMPAETSEPEDANSMTTNTIKLEMSERANPTATPLSLEETPELSNEYEQCHNNELYTEQSIHPNVNGAGTDMVEQAPFSEVSNAANPTALSLSLEENPESSNEHEQHHPNEFCTEQRIKLTMNGAVTNTVEESTFSEVDEFCKEQSIQPNIDGAGTDTVKEAPFSEVSNTANPAALSLSIEENPESSNEHEQHQNDEFCTEQSIQLNMNGAITNLVEDSPSSKVSSISSFVITDEENTGAKVGSGSKIATNIINDLHEVLMTDEAHLEAALFSPLFSQEKSSHRVKGGNGFRFAVDIISELNHVLMTDEGYPQAAVLSPETYVGAFEENEKFHGDESSSSEVLSENNSFVEQNNQRLAVSASNNWWEQLTIHLPDNRWEPYTPLQGFGSFLYTSPAEVSKKRREQDDREEADLFMVQGGNHFFHVNNLNNVKDFRTPNYYDEASGMKDSYLAAPYLAWGGSIGVLKKHKLPQIGDINLVLEPYVATVDPAIASSIWIGDLTESATTLNRSNGRNLERQPMKTFTAPRTRFQPPPPQPEVRSKKNVETIQIRETASQESLMEKAAEAFANAFSTPGKQFRISSPDRGSDDDTDKSVYEGRVNDSLQEALMGQEAHAAVASLSSRGTPIIRKKFTPAERSGNNHPINLQDSETTKPGVPITDKNWWNNFGKGRAKPTPPRPIGSSMES